MRLVFSPAPIATGLAALVLIGSLGGCISLLPKERPVQLYRFGVSPVASATESSASAAGTRFTIRVNVGTFDRAAASDRLLTVEGDKTAFIASARWVASAQSLFESALSNSFIASPGPARLLDRGELTAADYRLDITVRRFETRYESGPHAPPVVEVMLSASLDSNRGAPSRRDRSFEARTVAKADSMSAIVAAYSESVGEVLAKLRAWVEAKGRP